MTEEKQKNETLSKELSNINVNAVKKEKELKEEITQKMNALKELQILKTTKLRETVWENFPGRKCLV